MKKECDMQTTKLDRIKQNVDSNRRHEIFETLCEIVEEMKSMGIKHAVMNTQDMDIIFQPVKKAEIHEIQGK
jgi:chromosome segregation and condensation protein ScpB